MALEKLKQTKEWHDYMRNAKKNISRRGSYPSVSDNDSQYMALSPKVWVFEMDVPNILACSI